MVNVVLHLRDPLPHDSEHVCRGDGGATQKGRTPTAAGVEEGKVAAGTLGTQGRVHRGVGHGSTALAATGGKESDMDTTVYTKQGIYIYFLESKWKTSHIKHAAIENSHVG